MAEARVTKVYKNTSTGYGAGVPFGLTGDYVSMHSGINLERQLKIGSLKETFITKDIDKEQVIIYELYLDGTSSIQSQYQRCYLVKTSLGNEQYNKYIITKDHRKILTTSQNGRNLILLKKGDAEGADENHIATIKLYLAAQGTSVSDFANQNLQYICELEDHKYYGQLLSQKQISKTSGTNLISIKEVYSA